MTTGQKMQLCLTLSKNTENRRNLAHVFDYQRGHFKNHDQEGALANKKTFVPNPFHCVLVVVRPVKPLSDFLKSIITAGVSRKRSRVALFKDPCFLFVGDNKSSKHCAILLLGHNRTRTIIILSHTCMSILANFCRVILSCFVKPFG